MCVRIIGPDTETKYDAKRPLEEQIKGSEQIVIRYEPKDPDIDKFLGEMERFCKMGISTNITVEVSHKNSLKGARAKKQVNRIMRDLDLNEAIKLLVNLHSKCDRTLREMSNICKGK